MIKVQDLVTSDRNGILFVCVANSARSQMAEGFARFLGPSAIAVFSAGSTPQTVNPHAIAAMKEIGVDISTHRSKGLDDVPMSSIAVVVTLCDDAQCPSVGSDVQVLHWPLPDPATADGEPLIAFRRARDQIRELVSSLF